MLVTLGSLFAVFVLGTMAVGGVTEVWRLSEEGGRIVFWKYDSVYCASNISRRRNRFFDLRFFFYHVAAWILARLLEIHFGECQLE